MNNLKNFSTSAQRVINKYYANFIGLDDNEEEELRLALGGVDLTDKIIKWLDEQKIKKL